jgi:uncharacterized damage-inducible protein DinB
MEMKLENFLNEVQTANREWDALLTQISPERMTLPGAAGEWSIKDIAAHVSWVENEMVGMLQARALVESALREKTQDERNRGLHFGVV